MIRDTQCGQEMVFGIDDGTYIDMHTYVGPVVYTALDILHLFCFFLCILHLPAGEDLGHLLDALLGQSDTLSTLELL